jgi:hypothetical protein
VHVLYNTERATEMADFKCYGSNGQVIDLPCSKAVVDYIKYARCVDVANQEGYLYRLGLKSKTPNTRLLYWLLDAAMANAHRLSARRQVAKDFRVEVMTALVGLFDAESKQHRREPPELADAAPKNGLTNDHYPESTDVRRQCRR